MNDGSCLYENYPLSSPHTLIRFEKFSHLPSYVDKIPNLHFRCNDTEDFESVTMIESNINENISGKSDFFQKFKI